MSPVWISLGIAAVGLLVSVLFNFLTYRRATRIESRDENKDFIAKICRDELFEARIRELVTPLQQQSFSGRSEWVKDLAREVFRDQLMIIMNDDTAGFLQRREHKEFQDGFRREIDGLKEAIENLSTTVTSVPVEIRKAMREVIAEMPRRLSRLPITRKPPK